MATALIEHVHPWERHAVVVASTAIKVAPAVACIAASQARLAAVVAAYLKAAHATTGRARTALVHPWVLHVVAAAGSVLKAAAAEIAAAAPARRAAMVPVWTQTAAEMATANAPTARVHPWVQHAVAVAGSALKAAAVGPGAAEKAPCAAMEHAWTRTTVQTAMASALTARVHPWAQRAVAAAGTALKAPVVGTDAAAQAPCAAMVPVWTQTAVQMAMANALMAHVHPRAQHAVAVAGTALKASVVGPGAAAQAPCAAVVPV